MISLEFHSKHFHHGQLGWMVAMGLWCLVTTASAQAGPAIKRSRFGTAGQTVLFGGIDASLRLASRSDSEVAASDDDRGATAIDISLWVSPGVLHFFWDDIAFGVALDGGYANREIPLIISREWNLGASLAIGANRQISGDWSFFPRLWVGAGHSSRKSTLPFDPGPPMTSPFGPPPTFGRVTVVRGRYWSASLLLPVVYNFAQSTYLSFGSKLRWWRGAGDEELTFALAWSFGLGRFF